MLDAVLAPVRRQLASKVVLRINSFNCSWLAGMVSARSNCKYARAGLPFMAGRWWHSVS